VLRRAVTKRLGARAIIDIRVGDLRGVPDAVIEGYVDDHSRAVLAALCREAGARTFFEIGTSRGRTAWTVARNNPECHVYTLDLPAGAAEWDIGEAYHGMPEEGRITTLHGDSASFDFSPYAGRMDLVFVDGAHPDADVSNDTEWAFELLAAGGTIAWDGHPAVPGVYRRLNELARTLDRPLYHVRGTGLVIYTQADVVVPAGRRARGL